MKHGVSRDLVEGSEAAIVVVRAMKLLVDLLSRGLENHDQRRPQIHAIISNMGYLVWKAAINLKNQKGTISYSFRDDRQQPLHGRGERFMWFPGITVHKPLQSNDQKFIDEFHEPEYASANQPIEIPTNLETSTAEAAVIREESEVMMSTSLGDLDASLGPSISSKHKKVDFQKVERNSGSGQISAGGTSNSKQGIKSKAPVGHSTASVVDIREEQGTNITGIMKPVCTSKIYRYLDGRGQV